MFLRKSGDFIFGHLKDLCRFALRICVFRNTLKKNSFKADFGKQFSGILVLPLKNL